MWKRRIGWFTLAFVSFFAFTLVFGAATSLRPAGAAVLVIDTENILQNTLTAINTANQVTNELINLQSMSSDGLGAHYTAVAQDLAGLTGVKNAYAGLLNASGNLNNTWNGMFRTVDSYFDTSKTTQTLEQQTFMSQNTMNSLQATYKDGMATANQVVNTSQNESSQELQTALNKMANAAGEKEVIQATAQVMSVGVKEDIKTNQLLAATVANQASHGQAEIQDRAAALAINQKNATDYSAAVAKNVEVLKNDSRSVAEKIGESDSYISYLRSQGLLK